MADQLPEMLLLECRCAEVKYRSVLVSVGFAGKTFFFFTKMCGCIDYENKLKEYIIE